VHGNGADAAARDRFRNVEPRRHAVVVTRDRDGAIPRLRETAARIAATPPCASSSARGARDRPAYTNNWTRPCRQASRASPSPSASAGQGGMPADCKPDQQGAPAPPSRSWPGRVLDRQQERRRRSRVLGPEIVTKIRRVMKAPGSCSASTARLFGQLEAFYMENVKEASRQHPVAPVLTTSPSTGVARAAREWSARRRNHISYIDVGGTSPARKLRGTGRPCARPREAKPRGAGDVCRMSRVRTDGRRIQLSRKYLPVSCCSRSRTVCGRRVVPPPRMEAYPELVWTVGYWDETTR